MRLALAIISAHFNYIFGKFGFNLTNTLSLMIYSKAIKHPLLTEKHYSAAEIVNYSQVDAQRMTNIGYQLSAVVFGPIQIAIGLVLLYLNIGVSFLVGLGVMALMILLTLIFTHVAATINDALLEVKDERMQLTQEILEIIKFIKVSAQEKYFFQKLDQKREEELRLSKKASVRYVFVNIVYNASPSLIVCLTFLVFVGLGNPIDAAEAFTTILLFQILQTPIA